MKKDTEKTLLIVGGGLLAAYLLFPKVKETIQEGFKNAIPSFEWGGIGLGEGGIDLAGIISGAGTAAGAAAVEAVKDAFGAFLAGLTDGGGGEGDGDIAPIPEDTGKGVWQTIKDEAWGVTKWAGLVGGGAVAIRYGGPPVVRGLGNVFERTVTRPVTTKPPAMGAKAPTVAKPAPKIMSVKPWGTKINWISRLFKGGGIGGLSASTAYGVGLLPVWLLWEQSFPNIFAGHWGLPEPTGEYYGIPGYGGYYEPYKVPGGGGNAAPPTDAELYMEQHPTYGGGGGGHGGGGGGNSEGGGSGTGGPLSGVNLPIGGHRGPTPSEVPYAPVIIF